MLRVRRPSARVHGEGVFAYTPRMTTRAAVIWLVLAALFALGATITVRLASGRAVVAPETVRLLGGSLDEIGTITIRSAGRPELVLGADAGVWRLMEAGSAPWPIEPGRIPALLRVMAGTTGVRAPSGAIGDDATSIELRNRGGSVAAVLRIETASLAGRSLVEVEEGSERRRLLIDDALRRALAGAGPAGWRDKRVFPGLAPDPVVIRIAMPTHTIELARIGNRWGMRSPIQARAESGSIASVIRALQSMEAARFIDSAASDPGAFPEQPQVALTIETSALDPETGERSRSVWSLELGGAAPQGGSFIAKIGREAIDGSGGRSVVHGPVIVELPNERLASVPAAVEAYLARTLIDIPSSDVGGVVFFAGGSGEGGFVRAASGWMSTRSEGGADAPATERDRIGVESLVELASSVVADKTTVLESDDALPGGLPMRLIGLSGQTIEECFVFLERGGERAQLVMRSGRVARTYLIPEGLASWVAQIPATGS